MSLQDELRGSGEVAFAFAAALERSIGDDSLFTVGMTRDSIVNVLPDEPARAVLLDFSGDGGADGTLAFIALQRFADTIERSASDEILQTAVGVALEAAVQALAGMGGLDIEHEAAEEGDVATVTNALHGDVVVYPILEGTDPVGVLAIVLRTTAGSAHAQRPATGMNADAVPGAPFVLADVEMGVTAELGRTRMSIRELLSLTPGAVVDLDRAAGAPVDVLVNGTLIARGEVVVIEEEFGIRISEILKNGAPR